MARAVGDPHPGRTEIRGRPMHQHTDALALDIARTGPASPDRRPGHGRAAPRAATSAVPTPPRRSSRRSTSTTCASTRHDRTGPSATASCSPRATPRRSSTRSSPAAASSRSRNSRRSAASPPGCEGHPDMQAARASRWCAGPLGHGVAVGAGHGLARRGACPSRPPRARPRPAPPAARVYVLLGDGEIDAGVVWEGAMAAAKYRLGNLTAIVDYNGIQQTGATADVMPTEPIAEKWRGLRLARPGGPRPQRPRGPRCARPRRRGARPARRSSSPAPRRARGVSFMEYDHRWHGGLVPTPMQCEQALAELRASMRRARGGGDGMTTLAAHAPRVRRGARRARAAPARMSWSSRPTSRTPTSADMFAEAFPDRFFNVGIAEQSLVDVAVGLAYSGLRPLRQHLRLPLRHAGPGDGAHALLLRRGAREAHGRLRGRLRLVRRADPPRHHRRRHHAHPAGHDHRRRRPTRSPWRSCCRRSRPGPARSTCASTATRCPSSSTTTTPPRSARPSSLRAGRDVTLVGNGPHALAAAWTRRRRSPAEGIDARVLEMHTIKPLDTAAIVTAARGDRRARDGRGAQHHRRPRRRGRRGRRGSLSRCPSSGSASPTASPRPAPTRPSSRSSG